MDLGTHLLWDALDLFLLDCEARRLTTSTLQFYSVKLSLFLRWCDEQGIKTLQALTAHDLRRYFVSLHRRELSSQYQNNLARAIRAFLNYCVRDELLSRLALRQGADAQAGLAEIPGRVNGPGNLSGQASQRVSAKDALLFGEY